MKPTLHHLAQWYHEVTAGLSLSIRTRVILSYLIIVGVGFIFLTRKMSHEVHPRYLESERETLSGMAALLATMIAQSSSDASLSPTAIQTLFSHSLSGVSASELHLTLISPDKKLIFDSHPLRSSAPVPSATSSQLYAQESTPEKHALRVSLPVIREGETLATLTLSKPLEPIRNTQRRILLLGSAATVGAILLGILFSAWLTYPIRNLIRYAQDIRDGRRTPRPQLGHSEMRTLGLAFEEMRDALEGKDYVNRYIQTLTHEMKSPIAAIQGAAELLNEEMPIEDRKRFLANIQTESTRIREAVDSLLLLASVESQKSLNQTETVDLRKLIEGALHQLTARISMKAQRISHQFPSELATVSGDAFLLERTLLNLLENAIAFTPEGGEIRVMLSLVANNWQVTVHDSGPGLPDYALKRVFERFYSLPRPDTGRKSSGLGLAFVREVAILHGGTISLLNAPEDEEANAVPSQGAVATLTLPALL